MTFQTSMVGGLCCISALLGAPDGRAAVSKLPRTLYVAPEGNDSANGSERAPWKTLRRAAEQIEPGDTVIVRPGHYAGFVLEKGGIESAPLTFRAVEGAVIDSPCVNRKDGINLEGASYVTLEGFTVRGMPHAGIRAAVDKHVVIQNNTVDRARYVGILTAFSDDVLVRNNTCSNCGNGIYIGNTCARPVVRGNRVFGNRKNGIHINGDADMGGAGVITEALVEANIIYDNGTAKAGSGINCDGIQNGRIQNNLLYGNHATGIALYRQDSARPAKHNLVLNNTIVMAAGSRWPVIIQDASTDNSLYNNILWNDNSARGSVLISADCLAGFVSDYNAVMDAFSADGGDSRITLARWQAATGQDRHSFLATPDRLFVDAARSDYHLAADSLAVGRGTGFGGTDTKITRDLDGNRRPQQHGWDIGAYQHMPGARTLSGGIQSRSDFPVEPARAVALGSLSCMVVAVLAWVGVRRIASTARPR